MESRRHYGLVTTIAMIVGIVIGSGIFFKSDNILVGTGGSVKLGILVFCIAAVSIIFGSLTISNLASFTDRSGGVVAYSEEFINKRFASAFGWFQTFVYFPTLTTVISWVVGIYISLLFGINMTLNTQILIGFIWFIICFAYNMWSAKFGGNFQTFATIIKIIPLLLIGIAGLIFGNPSTAFTIQASATSSNANWVSAIGPIAFSFDGWIIATTVSHEVKKAKKNVPIALIFAPLFILLGYLIYFIGVCSYVGPAQVQALGDESVSYFATNLFGGFAAKALLAFVTISVMGTVNGVVLGYIRLPYSLAVRGMLPNSEWLKKINPKNDMPLNSGAFAMAICLVWWVIHYIVMNFNLLANSDVSEIAIVMTYVLYIVLYFRVFMFWRQGKIKSIVKGVVFPALATLGSLFIFYGGLQNPFFFIFVFICLVALLLGYFYERKAHEAMSPL